MFKTAYFSTKTWNVLETRIVEEMLYVSVRYNWIFLTAAHFRFGGR